MEAMFIEEQKGEFRELQAGFRDEWIERLIWSPVANRHCIWGFEALVRVDEKGRIVKGSRRRNPFPPYSVKRQP